MSYSEQQAQLEALEKRAAELTLELANVNAAILSLKNRQAADMAPPPPPLPSAWPAATAAPALMSIPSLSLPPLPVAFAEEAPPAPAAPAEAPQENSGQPEPCVRLYGLLQNTTPWETRIPLSLLARQGGVILGRDPESADIVVADGNISRAHARLELEGDSVVVTDLGSTNGTSINGHALPPHAAQLPLWAGMPMVVGETTLYAEFV